MNQPNGHYLMSSHEETMHTIDYSLMTWTLINPVNVGGKLEWT